MPKLTIDGLEVEVPEGLSVLEAAKKLGIVIPHFCYHDALGPVGACRLCAMKFIEGPVKGVQMSCMVKAADGMVVQTADPDAMRVRRMVIEWLMTNHPHDCPVCDEGGMCLLQDYTIAGGHGIRRYKGKKRTYLSQYLGEFIEQEMNRCIQCYRCHRFYRDYAGGIDFGTKRIANQTFFGRFKDGWLDSEFSGNLADVCPTGVFTDKTYRFKGRLWELETAPSVCPHCALGCNVTPGAKLREVVVIKARENLKVNGWFICDRGRFGYRSLSSQDRPRKFLVNGQAKDRDDAAKAAAKIISDILAGHGPGSVAFMGSPRTSVENNYAMGKLATLTGAENICFSADAGRERKDRLAVSNLKAADSRRSLRDVEFSDFIIAVGADPVNEAPMLALMMRQAERHGARIVVMDPRPVKLPFVFTHVQALPEEFRGKLTELIKSELKDSKNPLIICGTDIPGFDTIDACSDSAKKSNCGLLYTLSAANSFGAAVMAGNGPDFEDILSGIEKGAIKTLIVFESDPLGMYPDRERVSQAVKKLEALIVMDYLSTETAKAADVFFPTAAYAEMDGIFVNNDGRAQAFARAYIPGIPVNTMGPKLHPPREFVPEVPGRSYPAWEYARDIARVMEIECRDIESLEAIRQSLAGSTAEFASIDAINPESPGMLITAGYEYSSPPAAPALAGEGLILYAIDLTFGTEEISTRSDKTQLKAPTPYVLINAEDARESGLNDGDRVKITSGDLSLSCGLRTSTSCAKGAAFAPKLHGFDAAALSGKRVKITGGAK
ncbi:MAG: NADH-quinone oxidoreductase subunit NuoG [Nitrospirota bacterium]